MFLREGAYCKKPVANAVFMFYRKSKTKPKTSGDLNQGFSSVMEHLPSEHRLWGSVPSTTRTFFFLRKGKKVQIL